MQSVAVGFVHEEKTFKKEGGTDTRKIGSSNKAAALVATEERSTVKETRKRSPVEVQKKQ